MLNYLKLYNHHISQRTIAAPPIQALKEWQQKKPDLFVKRVYDQTGLDNAKLRYDQCSIVVVSIFLSDAYMSGYRQMEQDVVGRFSREVETRFLTLHAAGTPLPYVIGSALSGQDSDLADYLLAARGRFALIEFKANRNAVSSELEKNSRFQLLQICRDDTGTLARAQAIHHFAWEKLVAHELPYLGKQIQATIEVARYIPELARAARMCIPPANARTWSSGDFISSYLEVESAGTNIYRFQRYLEELYSIAGKNGTTELGRFEGAILIFVPESTGTSQLLTLRFTSFNHLMELTIAYERTLKRQHDRESDGPTHDIGWTR